jgi:hypothetical protein
LLTRKYSEQEMTVLLGESEVMAQALESRHGVHAAAVADFFATFHDQNGDFGRSCAWSRVAATVRRRHKVRIAAGRC